MNTINTSTTANSIIAGVIQRLEQNGCNPRQKNSGWVANCPACRDKKLHLGIAEGIDGRVLLNCFRGCGIEAIVKSIGFSLSNLYRHNECPAQTFSGPIEQLAHIRSWSKPAFLALGAKAEGDSICFPMRDASGNEVGAKLRRGDNKPFQVNMCRLHFSPILTAPIFSGQDRRPTLYEPWATHRDEKPNKPNPVRANQDFPN